METQVQLKIGDKIRVSKSSVGEAKLRGLECTIVSIGPDGIGVDFGVVVRSLTWDLNGMLPAQTGRYMGYSSLELIQEEWDT